jgi:hypothetical protein
MKPIYPGVNAETSGAPEGAKSKWILIGILIGIVILATFVSNSWYTLTGRNPVFVPAPHIESPAPVSDDCIARFGGDVPIKNLTLRQIEMIQACQQLQRNIR